MLRWEMRAGNPVSFKWKTEAVELGVCVRDEAVLMREEVGVAVRCWLWRWKVSQVKGCRQPPEAGEAKKVASIPEPLGDNPTDILVLALFELLICSESRGADGLRDCLQRWCKLFLNTAFRNILFCSVSFCGPGIWEWLCQTALAVLWDCNQAISWGWLHLKGWPGWRYLFQDGHHLQPMDTGQLECLQHTIGETGWSLRGQGRRQTWCPTWLGR